MSPETTARRLARAEAQVAALEQLIEDKSRELFEAALAVESSRAQLEDVFRTAPTAIFVCDRELRVLQANHAASALVARPAELLVGEHAARVLGVGDLAERLRDHLDRSGDVTRLEVVCRPDGHEGVPVVLSAACDPTKRVVLTCLDLRREKQLELELRHAQKLEAVGQLAAGVAHEINTPIQFVGDSLFFLGEAFTDILRVARGEASPEEADLDYLVEHVPEALARCEEGVGRVAEIVRALKELSHPDAREKAPADLNRAIQNAITVAKNETKYVAEVGLELGDIPSVECHLGDVSQVLLNLIVNAAHAIEDRMKREGSDARRGNIRISTARESAAVHIAISDDGGGIPEHVRERIFEPFFTTKPVGKGTGQGLPIVRSIVIDRHGGELWFDTEIGLGTTFHVRLPVKADRSETERAA